jgi:hypothetical protein
LGRPELTTWPLTAHQIQSKLEPCRSRSSLVHGLSVHLQAISPYFWRWTHPAFPPSSCAKMRHVERARRKGRGRQHSSVQLICCQPAPELPSAEYDSLRIEQLNLRLPRADHPRRGDSLNRDLRKRRDLETCVYSGTGARHAIRGFGSSHRVFLPGH